MTEPGATPAEPGLDWMPLWPEGKELRTAANGTAPCQRALADDWAAVLVHRDGKSHLLAHAPTGLGKTLAALAPALAWVAEAPDRRRVYYLVNRVAQHENPLRELRDGLAARFEARTGQPLRVVDIVSRELLCAHPHAQTLTPTCRAARDQADFAALPAGVPSWHDVKAGLSGRTCPYHTLQGLMAKAHVVVCDYWWLFSPMAQELGLTQQAGFSPTDSIVIVDEAHNLAPRVRGWLDVDETPDRLAEAVQPCIAQGTGLPGTGSGCARPGCNRRRPCAIRVAGASRRRKRDPCCADRADLYSPAGCRSGHAGAHLAPASAPG